jgi:hypothetical protein
MSTVSIVKDSTVCPVHTIVTLPTRGCDFRGWKITWDLISRDCLNHVKPTFYILKSTRLNVTLPGELT